MTTDENKIYTVTAYRYGNANMHSYIVGVYTKKNAALKAAAEEGEYRGFKYRCSVIEWVPDAKHKDGSPGMPGKRIMTI